MMSPRFGLVLAVLLLAPMLWALPAAGQDASVSLDELLFVTQGKHRELGLPRGQGPGCNSVSIFRLSDATALFRLDLAQVGLQVGDGCEVSDVAATTDFRLVLVGRGGTGLGLKPPPTLLRLAAAPGSWTRWTALPPIVGADFMFRGGLAIMPDDDTLLVGVWAESVADDGGLAKYRLSEIAPDGQLGPRRGFIQLPPPSESGRRLTASPPTSSAIGAPCFRSMCARWSGHCPT